MTAYHLMGDGIIYQEMDDEIVVINLETGTYYQLNAPAAWIWKAIESQIPLEMMPAWFCARYNADPGDLVSPLESFLFQLQQEDLIAPSPVENEVKPSSFQEMDRLPYQPPALNKFSDMQDLLLLDPIHEVDESGWPNKA